MNGALATIGTAVALVASIVAVVVAVEQLTLRARLKKTAEVTAELAGGESGARAVSLNSVRRVALARLAAGWIVPGWRLAETAIYAVAGPVSVGFIVWGQGVRARTTWAFCALTFVLLAIVFRQSLRVVLERQRISRQFYSNQTVMPPRLRLTEKSGWQLRQERLVGASASLGLVILGLAVGGFAANSDAEWPVWAAIPGVALVSITVQFARSGQLRPLDYGL